MKEKTQDHTSQIFEKTFPEFQLQKYFPGSTVPLEISKCSWKVHTSEFFPNKKHLKGIMSILL